MKSGHKQQLLSVVKYKHIINPSGENHSNSGHLYGYYLATLIHGYLENNFCSGSGVGQGLGLGMELEEIIEQSIRLTNYNDFLSIQNKLNYLLLSGRSSELLTAIKVYSPYYESEDHFTFDYFSFTKGNGYDTTLFCIRMNMIMFILGYAYSQRGNNRGLIVFSALDYSDIKCPRCISTV
jgi:hypothetical protein